MIEESRSLCMIFQFDIFFFSLFSRETIAVGLFNNSAQVCSMWFFLNLNRVTKACLSRKSQMTEIQLFTSLRPLS